MANSKAGGSSLVDSDADVVGLFDKVTVYHALMNTEMTLRIVTTLRQDALQDRISKESPVGSALLGHKVGETVTVKVNDQLQYDLTIRAIEKGQDDESLSISSF